MLGVLEGFRVSGLDLRLREVLGGERKNVIFKILTYNEKKNTQCKVDTTITLLKMH